MNLSALLDRLTSIHIVTARHRLDQGTKTLLLVRRMPFLFAGPPFDFELEAATMPSTKILPKAEVCDLVGVSYQSLWNWMRADKFPRSITVGPGKIGWYETEVAEWIAARPRTVLKGDRQPESA